MITMDWKDRKGLGNKIRSRASNVLDGMQQILTLCKGIVCCHELVEIILSIPC
jgi:hypothetical protein